MTIFKIKDKTNKESNKIINKLFRADNTYHNIREAGIFILDNELYIESNRWNKLLVPPYTIGDIKKYFIYVSTNSISLKPELYNDYINKKCFTNYLENELFFSIKIENILLDIVNPDKLINSFSFIYKYLLDRIKLFESYNLEFTEEFKSSDIYSLLFINYII